LKFQWHVGVSLGLRAFSPKVMVETKGAATAAGVDLWVKQPDRREVAILHSSKRHYFGIVDAVMWRR